MVQSRLYASRGVRGGAAPPVLKLEVRSVGAVCERQNLLYMDSLLVSFGFGMDLAWAQDGMCMGCVWNFCGVRIFVWSLCALGALFVHSALIFCNMCLESARGFYGPHLGYPCIRGGLCTFLSVSVWCLFGFCFDSV